MTTAGKSAGAANGAKPTVPTADDGWEDAADEELAHQLAERAQPEGIAWRLVAAQQGCR